MSTLADIRTDAIEHLDFTPACCCESAETCGHPTGTECGADASVIAAVHRFHQCTDAVCDANGDEVGPLCHGCLDRFTAEARDVTARIRRNHVAIACTTCGAPMWSVSDIIRDVRELR